MSRDFSGECTVDSDVVYREGQWGRPIWWLSRSPLYFGSSFRTLPIQLPPGESVQPQEWRSVIPVEYVLGDSLMKAGLYRPGALEVRVGGRYSFAAPGMVASEPVRLEAVP